MDGVLVVNDSAHQEAFRVWSEQKGIEMPSDFLERYYGMGNDEIMPGLFGRPLSKEEIDIYAAEKEAVYREIYAKDIAPTAGLIELLEELHKRGIKMAVGSSGNADNVNFIVDGCGIRKYFTALVHSGLAAKAKPAPDIFLKAAEMMGLEPSECFVFEDAFAGIKAARAAGMKLGVLATSFSREEHKDYDVIIDDFRGITADEILAL